MAINLVNLDSVDYFDRRVVSSPSPALYHSRSIQLSAAVL